MKTLLLFLVGCSITLSLMSQTAVESRQSKKQKGILSTLLRLRSNTNQGEQLKAGSVKQKLDSTISVEYDTTSKKWVNNYKDVYTYNAKGYNSVDLGYDFSGTMWVKSVSSTYTYDNNENNILEIDNYLDGTEDSIVNTYDSKGINITTSDYYYDGMQWTINSSSKYIYTYAVNGNPICEIDQDLNTNTNKFVNTDSIIYTFSGSYPTVINDYSWDATKSKWATTAGITNFTYDANNDISMFTTPITITVSVNSVPTDTVVQFKEEYTYNTTCNSNDLLLPVNGLTNMFDSHIEQSEVTKTAGYVLKKGSWTVADSAHYYYSASTIASDINAIGKDDIVLYPNPAHSCFSINTPEKVSVAVYGINGSLVFQTTIAGNEPIKTENMPAGLYFVKIISGTTVITKTLVIN